MRYYRIPGEESTNLVADDESGAFDLTSVRGALESFADLARAAGVSGRSVDDIAADLIQEADEVPQEAVTETALRPLVPDEVWAAGVTYEISEAAREEESGMPDMYLDVYEAERPEVFFKATANRTVGPGDDVGIRADSDWDVPEPELGIVLHEGEIVGFTVGNDVSSRAIEGQNPLYLPQAKIYDRSCAIGPCVVSADSIDDPHDLGMSMRIERDGEVHYEEATSTGEMKRTCEELVSFYTRHNAVAESAVLLTGTSLVPEEGFTLAEGDRITIEIEDVGTLENGVTVV